MARGPKGRAAKTRGLSAPGRHAIQDLAREHLQRGWHTGAQLAVYRDGEVQLDFRVGNASHEDDRLLYFSATKPLTAVAALALVAREQISLDMPLVEVWPEFGSGGKGACTIRHVLTHQGGFPVFPHDYSWERIDDWNAVAELTAGMTADWEPGTDTGYHPVTFGTALGELIRRVDGRRPREFMRSEIFEPLGMQTTLGVTDAEAMARVVLPVAMSESSFDDPDGTERRTSEIVERFRLPSTLRAELPAANAVGTAEALARFYAMLERRWSGSTAYAGVCPLPPELVRAATQVQHTADFDRTSHLPSSYGLGFLVGGAFAPFNEPDVFGHTGQQCVIGYADPRRGLAVAYVTNGLQDPLTVQLRTEQMAAAIVEACD
ncbi:MAG: serine hydrolase [Chloroflexi bacterium]|nr:serine hydrolase [Chloroflexota bacterium]MDA1145131.1 serine hydrolase [Chloroflexota bacterium]